MSVIFGLQSGPEARSSENPGNPFGGDIIGKGKDYYKWDSLDND
jgi:hypothetical protein